MLRIYSRTFSYTNGKNNFLTDVLLGNASKSRQTIHVSNALGYPIASLRLPSNMEDINASEVGRFGPTRERDISGPVINSCYQKQEGKLSHIDITLQVDPHVNKYDCHGAVSLSSSMQSNVPSPFHGNNTHLNMPGSQWGQGYKYLSDHLHGAHYLTLRNEYRHKMFDEVGSRKMSSNTTDASLSSKEKLKRAVKDYGATVIVFHVSISLISLGGCYILVSSGVDLMALLRYFNLEEGVVSKVAGGNVGTFVIAYAVHKCLAPFRIAITLGSTPFIVRYLRKIGILKNKQFGGGK